MHRRGRARHFAGRSCHHGASNTTARLRMRRRKAFLQTCQTMLLSALLLEASLAPASSQPLELEQESLDYSLGDLAAVQPISPDPVARRLRTRDLDTIIAGASTASSRLSLQTGAGGATLPQRAEATIRPAPPRPAAVQPAPPRSPRTVSAPPRSQVSADSSGSSVAGPATGTSRQIAAPRRVPGTLAAPPRMASVVAAPARIAQVSVASARSALTSQAAAGMPGR